MASIPRLHVALTADLGPDEPIYIDVGRVYIRLLYLRDFTSRDWLENLSHPALPKLILGFAAIVGRRYLGMDPIVAARMSSVGAGVLTVVALFVLGRRPFGTQASLLAALVLAVAPWHVFWSGLAMLDSFLVLFLSLSFLTLLHSRWHPVLAILGAGCFGLAFSSKYTAALAVPTLIVLGLLSLRPKSVRSWLITLACPFVACAVALGGDPPVWADPWGRFVASVLWQLYLVSLGHTSFFDGQVMTHTPWWVAGYVVLAKNSSIVLAFALSLFCSLAVGVFRCRNRREAIVIALIWLWGMIAAFCTLTIVVADHYVLPVSVPLAICAGLGAVKLGDVVIAAAPVHPKPVRGALGIALLLPLVVGLAQFPTVEGFTNELMRPQNRVLPVATTGYDPILRWIAAREPGATVAAPYFAQGARWAIRRDRLPIVLSSEGERSPDFVIVPSFFYQYRLVNEKLTLGYHLTRCIGEGDVTYACAYTRQS